MVPRNRRGLSGRSTQRSRPLVEDLAARGQRRVTLIVPSGCAESLVLLARELRARQRVATAGVTQRWRRLSPSAELLVDVKTGARCTMRDTGGPGSKRYSGPPRCSASTSWRKGARVTSQRQEHKQRGL